MAQLTTNVSLVAQVSGYISGMQQAAAATANLGSQAEQLAQQQDAIVGLGKAAFAFGAVAASAVGLAVAKYAEFDQAMSNVQAATHASSQEMGQLRDAAIDAGAKTVFTATSAAQAIEEMSKAGISTADILNGGLNGALALASAGELDVADAASIAATAMTQFKLKGSEVPHIADLLAAGAGKAQGSVHDLANALNQGGLVASQAGFKIEETTGTLAAFASAGLLGSDAGTSLKTAIIALQNPSTQAAGVMKQYGIDVYDSSGKMLSFGGIAAQLQDKLGGLTDEQRNSALATIFGNDAVRAANVLYANGADGIASWTAKVNDNGYAAETARLKLNNLKGDIEKLGGSFDTALIKSGSAANDTLRSLTQGATFLVDSLGSIPPPMVKVGVGAVALVGGFALVGGAALIAVPKIAAMKVQLQTMGVSLRTAATRTAVAGAAFGLLTVGIGLLVSRGAQAKATTEELTSTLDKQTGLITKYTRATVAKKLADNGAFDAAKEAGVGQKELTDAVLKGGDALDSVQKKIGKNNTFGGIFTGVSERAGFAQQRINDLSRQIDDSQKSFENQKAATDDSKASTMSAAEAYKQEAAQVSDLSSQLADLISQIQTANDANQDAVSANADYQQALAGLKDQVEQQKESTKGYSNTLDQNTAIGSGNASMLSDIAGKAQTAAEKQFALDQSTMSSKDASDKYSATLADQRQKFIDSAVGAGFNRDQVQSLADKVFALPSAKQVQIIADTLSAANAVDNIGKRIGDLIYRYDGKHISIIADLKQGTTASLPGVGNVAYAEGGAVRGPGTGTSDSIYARLSNGEHVFDAKDVALMGGQAGVYAFRAALEKGQLGRFASGGEVRMNPTFVPTPQQLIYAPPAAPAAGGYDGPSSVSFTVPVPATATLRETVDELAFFTRSKLRGAR